MVSRLRWLVLAAILGFLGLLGYWYMRYAFDTTIPTISIVGIENGGSYAGDVTCVITGNDDYKVGHISIWLDDKLLVNHHKINRQAFDYAFPLDTKALSRGKHLLKVLVEDASSRKNSVAQELLFYVDNTPLAAAFLKSDGEFKVFQGRILHVQFQVNKEIHKATVEALSQQYNCIPESANSLIYECFIPISCEELPNEHVFKITIQDKVGEQLILENKFDVVLFPFKKHTLLNASTDRTTADEGVLSEAQFEKDVADASRNSPCTKLWLGSFFVPIDTRGTSTEFGTLRTTQQRGKYRHNALDLLGTPRAVVWAPQDGIVVIKNSYEHSGNTVVIDHGCGILSMLFHLDSFAPIEVGDKIKKGKPVGTIGKTGYASGYHLHWEMRVCNVQVDPNQWTQQSF